MLIKIETTFAQFEKISLFYSLFCYV